MGKKVQLKKMNVSQKWTLPRVSLSILPNILGNQ